MSEEEKKAIELLKKLQKKTPYIIWGDGTPYNKSNQIQIILNVINNQQKEIEEKTTIIMAGAEKVKQLEKEIVDLQTKLEIEAIDNKYNQEERDEETIPRYKIRDILNYLNDTELNNYEIVMAFKKMMKELLEDGDHIPRID